MSINFIDCIIYRPWNIDILLDSNNVYIFHEFEVIFKTLFSFCKNLYVINKQEIKETILGLSKNVSNLHIYPYNIVFHAAIIRYRLYYIQCPRMAFESSTMHDIWCLIALHFNLLILLDVLPGNLTIPYFQQSFNIC